MLPFFRRIRRNHLFNNRLGKYLPYAIGEIFLVVVGILIALQINNWNEQRKLEFKEESLLRSFQEGLTTDLGDIEFNLLLHERAIKSIDIILEALENDLPYHDSLAFHFGNTSLMTKFVYSTSAFETFKSEGIYLISDPDLRKRIITVYDSKYGFVLNFESIMFKEITHLHQEVLSKRFDQMYNVDLSHPQFRGEMVPLDFESLKSDQEFLYFLRSLRNHHKIHKGFIYPSLQRDLRALLDILKIDLASE